MQEGYAAAMVAILVVSIWRWFSGTSHFVATRRKGKEVLARAAAGTVQLECRI
jgi:hypothetical protein